MKAFAIFTLISCVIGQVVFDVLSDYTVNDESLIDFHKNLVELQSISPNELSVAKYIEEFLLKQGLEVELQYVEENRYNVYSYIKSRDNKILLTSHIDTVPPFIPYSVKGSKIFGRGTCDAKGSVASQVFAYLSLLKEGLIKDGDIAMLFVVGEEVSGPGMRAASDHLNTTWDIGIFGEPTELKLGVGHKGILLADIQVKGKASHSGYPELGISATEIILPVLNDLLNMELPYLDLLGPTTLNIGKISAGVAVNVIPASANASLFYRVSNDLDKLVADVNAALSNIEHLDYSINFVSPPQYLDFKVPGFESIILAYATDIPNLQHDLSKRYLYGPGSIHVAHGDDEFVDSKDLVEAIEGYKKLILYSL